VTNQTCRDYGKKKLSYRLETGRQQYILFHLWKKATKLTARAASSSSSLCTRTMYMLSQNNLFGTWTPGIGSDRVATVFGEIEIKSRAFQGLSSTLNIFFKNYSTTVFSM